MKPSCLQTLQGGSVMTFPFPSRHLSRTISQTLSLPILDYSLMTPLSIPRLQLPCHPPVHFSILPYHLLTWHSIRILDPFLTHLCLPSYLCYHVRYLDLLWQAFPRPPLYLTLAMYDD